MSTSKQIDHLLFSDKIAQMSKDNSTKVGAVFFDEDNTSPIVFGYNGMPRGLDDNDPIKTARPEKYSWFEHAERNAIYNAAQDIMEKNNAIIFCSQFPSMEGARAIVSSGIKKVIFPKENENRDARVIELFYLSQVHTVEVDLTYQNKTGVAKKYADYLELAKEYGEIDSHEKAEKKSGVLILNEKTLTPIATGVARPPKNVSVPDSVNKENIHMWINEPEKDAIFNAVSKKLKDSVAYVNWCPCSRCSLALVSVKVKKVVTKEPDFTQEADRRWKNDFERTRELFEEVGIEFVPYSKTDIEFHQKEKNQKKKIGKNKP